jgi:hypothetical protein
MQEFEGDGWSATWRHQKNVEGGGRTLIFSGIFGLRAGRLHGLLGNRRWRLVGTFGECFTFCWSGKTPAILVAGGEWTPVSERGDPPSFSGRSSSGMDPPPFSFFFHFFHLDLHFSIPLLSLSSFSPFLFLSQVFLLFLPFPMISVLLPFLL